MDHAFHYNQHGFREALEGNARSDDRHAHQSDDHLPKCKPVLSSGVLQGANGGLALYGELVRGNGTLVPYDALALSSGGLVPCGVLVPRSGALVLRDVLVPRSDGLNQYSGMLALRSGALVP